MRLRRSTDCAVAGLVFAVLLLVGALVYSCV
jgi:hypothetical protein